MNQQKIGLFLKELRRQKGVTQEQLAEVFNVSNRTVSRWENGYNMPDLDVLIEISDYYQVDLRELLDGKRKSEKMNKEKDKEMEDIVLKAVAYTNTETEFHNKRVRLLLQVGVISFLISQIISRTALDENAIFSVISDFTAGTACGMMIVGIIVTSRFGMKLKAFKQRLLKRI